MAEPTRIQLLAAEIERMMALSAQARTEYYGTEGWKILIREYIRLTRQQGE
jgi:hypothetical protein